MRQRSAIRRFPVGPAPFFQNEQEVIVHYVCSLDIRILVSVSGRAGDAFPKRCPCFRDGSLQSKKWRGLFSGQIIHPAFSHRTKRWGSISIKRITIRNISSGDLKAAGLLHIFRNTHHRILILDALQAEVHPGIQVLPSQGVYVLCARDRITSVSVFFVLF